MWGKITIRQYFLLQKKLINVKGYDRALMIACELKGLDINKEKAKGINNLSKLIKDIEFFGTLPMDKPKCTAVIGGKEILFKPLASITSGEFIDIQSYEQDPKLDSLDTVAWQIARLSASEEIKALSDSDGYKAEGIIKDYYQKVLDLDMDSFCSLYAFFLNKQKNSSFVFLLYLVQNLNQVTKMKLRRIQTERTQSKRSFLSLKGLRLRISEAYLVNYRKLLALRCSNLRLSWNQTKANNEL